MELDNVVKECTKKIFLSRMRLILRNPFYGLLLMHVNFGIDNTYETAYTDGEKICFNSTFINEISNDELDFVMMHELLHIVLRHCNRYNNRDSNIFNIACDIVVNSNIMHSHNDDVKKITLGKYGESMHKTPNGDEGYKYTAEEVYEMLYKGRKDFKNQSTEKNKNYNGRGGENFGNDSKKTKDKEDGESKSSQNIGKCHNGNFTQKRKLGKGIFDEHRKWQQGDKDSFSDDEWFQRLKDAVEIVENKQEKTCGSVPVCAKRLLESYGKAQLDWRTILNNFLSEEVNDYSFTPPDRRYESDFFLPDFNDVEYNVRNILFMIDTSGSMSDKEIKTMYSEIKGAIEQFNGKLTGFLGFFDAKVVKPKEFCDESEFEIIKAYGGGGTSFKAIFEYINKRMQNTELNAIIILTDGYADFPAKEKIPDIPLLWVINNKERTPPYGKILRVETLD